MASSSHCFFIVSMALVSQLLVASASALRLTSTNYIDKLCSQREIDNKTFCLQTLSAYPPATSAKTPVSLAKAVFLGIVKPQAEKAATFAAAQKDPTFDECRDAFVYIQEELTIAAEEVVDEPVGANYDVSICWDGIKTVYDSIGTKQDPASKTLMEMTTQLHKKFIPLALAATVVAGA